MEMKSKSMVSQKTSLALVTLLVFLLFSGGTCLPASPNHGGIFFEEKGSKIHFANRYVSVEFIKSKETLILSNLHGVGKSQEYISSEPRRRSSLWQLTFRKDTGKNKKEFIISGLDKAMTSFSVIQPSKDEATLVLNWQGLSVGEEDNKIDVRAEVSLKADLPFSFWRINVTNRSKIFGLWCVYFPVIELVPIGKNPEDNYLAIGRSRGLLVKDPFHSNPHNAFGIAAQKGSSWPGALNMQFQALYDIAGNGLYLAAHDGEGYKKDFYFLPNPKREMMEYKIGHYPANMGYPYENYRMGYDVVVGPFGGDWYDAAQIYRSWALRQTWCRNGLLKVRKDIPVWFKETPIMLKVLSNKGEEDIPKLKERIIDFVKFIDKDLPVNWYKWKKYIPMFTAFNGANAQLSALTTIVGRPSTIHEGNYPILPAISGFSSLCDEVSKAGGHILPYVSARIYDPGINENAPFAKEAKPYTMKDIQGKIKYENKGITWQMCYHTKMWQDRLKDTVSELMKKEHARGIYFDTFYGGYVQCYDTRHGHTHGGGNDPYLGARKIATVVREAMKRVDPDSMMTGENPAETAIDLLDGFLYRWNAWPEMIPLFATVYGDSIPRYGMDLNHRSDGFITESALLFVEGAIMGRLSVHGDDLLKDFDKGSIYTEKMKFLKKLAIYKRPSIGGSYLSYGQLLRPLRLTKVNPELTVSYKNPEQRYKGGRIAVTALQSGVFKAFDGSIGIFIVNVTGTPVSFQFDLPAEKYPLPSSKNIEVMRIEESGEKHFEGKFKVGQINIKREIAGHDVIFFSIRAPKENNVVH